MTAIHRMAGAITVIAILTGCSQPYEPTEIETAEPAREACAEVLVQFSPDSPVLLPMAREAMLQTLNRVETDCEGASIEIIAYGVRLSDPIAYARTSVVEDAIVRHYGVEDTRIYKQTRVAPRESLPHRVIVSLRTDEPTPAE